MYLAAVIFGFDQNERYPDAPAVPRWARIRYRGFTRFGDTSVVFPDLDDARDD